MLRALFAGAGLLFALSAQALSGEEIVRYCESNACGGYFIGAFDAFQIGAALGSDKQRSAFAICPPDQLDDEQKVEIALTYLQRHPESQHLQAGNLALRAWREQWPCR